MARTYLTTNNSRGNPVTAMSPTFVHFRGWDAGIRVYAILEPGQPDRFDIYMTHGSNGSGNDIYLGRITDLPNIGPTWFPND